MEPLPNEALDRRKKILRTVPLTVPFLLWGMSLSILWTTVPDMRTRLSTDVHHLAYAFSVGTVGAMLGGPSAIVVDRYNHHSNLILGLSMLGASLVFALYPFSYNLYIMAALYFIYSFCFDFYQAAAHSVITNLWDTKGIPARFAIHFAFPIGSVLGPLIAMPFVTKYNKAHRRMSTTTTRSPLVVLRQSTVNRTLSFEAEYSDEESSNIEWAYLIVAGCIFVMGIVFLTLHYLDNLQNAQQINPDEQTEKKTLRQIISPNYWAHKNPKFGIFIFICGVMLVTLQAASIKGTQEYLVTYVVDRKLMTNQRASLLNSLTFAAGGVARFILVFISSRVSAPKILLFLVFGQCFSGLLCLLLGTNSILAMWITTPILGFFRESLWPMMYAWIDYHVVLLGVSVGLVSSLSRIFDIGLVTLQGYLYDYTVKESIFYTTIGYGALMCLAVSVITCYTSTNRGRKHWHSEKRNMQPTTSCIEDVSCNESLM